LCGKEKGWVAEGKGRGECPAFFYVSIIYTGVIKKGSQSRFGKLTIPDYYFQGEFRVDSFYSTVPPTHSRNQGLRRISACEWLLSRVVFREYGAFLL